MLHLRPDLVHLEKAADFRSFQEDLAGSKTHLRAYGPHAFGWKMFDLNAQGAAGDARAATQQKGVALIAHAAAAFVELLEDVHTFDTGMLD